MTRDSDLSRLQPIAERVTRSYGLELFDLQLRRESIGWILRVVIDRPARVGEDGAIAPERYEDSISIEECQRVSRDLSAVLDVEDAVERTYTLEVSSPGLDRPLRHADDFRRFTGRLAKLVAREAIEGQTHFAGRIAGIEADAVLLEQGRRVHRVPLALVTRAKLDVEF
jgi:ribosome maturation factor RimP